MISLVHPPRRKIDPAMIEAARRRAVADDARDAPPAPVQVTTPVKITRKRGRPPTPCRGIPGSRWRTALLRQPERRRPVRRTIESRRVADPGEHSSWGMVQGVSVGEG